MLLVKFRWISFSGCREESNYVSQLNPLKFSWITGMLSGYIEVENVLANSIIGQGGHLCFPIGTKTHLLGRWIILPIKFCWSLFSGRSEVEKASFNLMLGWPYLFSGWPENKNLVEDGEYLFPDKFCWISFSCCRGEFQNVSGNQRLGRPSWFSFGRPEKYKLGRWRLDHASYEMSLDSAQLLDGRIRKYLSQSEIKAVFRSAPKKNLVENVSLKSILRLKRKSRKYLSQSEARAPSRQTWYRTFKSWFLCNFFDFCSAVAEKSKMSQPIRD